MIHCRVRHRINRIHAPGGDDWGIATGSRSELRLCCEAADRRRHSAGVWMSLHNLEADESSSLTSIEEEMEEFCMGMMSQTFPWLEHQCCEDVLEDRSCLGATSERSSPSSQLVSAIHNAYDCFGEGGRSTQESSVDSVADELLGELERAATQVADMESEMMMMRARVQESESREIFLVEELNRARNRSSNRHCCYCSSVAKRLAVLEDISMRKDETILELEREIHSLQTKISSFLDHRSNCATPAKKPPGKKLFASESIENVKTIEKKVVRRSSNSNILTDLTPNVQVDR